MESLKLVVVLGVLAVGFAYGIAYLLAALTGGSITGDEAVRIGIQAFLVAACVVLVLRRRAPR